MLFNAYILQRTITDWDDLLEKLRDGKFEFNKDGDGDIRVVVPLSRYEEFAKIVQAQLNAPYNYVDIGYPEEKVLVVVFEARVFVVKNKVELEEVKKWAIGMGLPPKEADMKPAFF